MASKGAFGHGLWLTPLAYKSVWDQPVHKICKWPDVEFFADTQCVLLQYWLRIPRKCQRTGEDHTIIIIIKGMRVLDLHVLLMSINLHLSLTNPLRELPLFVVAAFPPKPTTNAVIIALFPPRVNKIFEVKMDKAITDNQVKPAQQTKN